LGVTQALKKSIAKAQKSKPYIVRIVAIEDWQDIFISIGAWVSCFNQAAKISKLSQIIILYNCHSEICRICGVEIMYGYRFFSTSQRLRSAMDASRIKHGKGMDSA
jgi:hypothetical protein